MRLPMSQRVPHAELANALALLVAIVPALASAWGFAAHRELTSRLHEPLAESCLKALVTVKQSSAFQDDSCDPDRWRDTDANEWPRHFVQLDRVDPPSDYPREYDDAVAHFGSDYNARRNGTVPWRVEERYALLVAAFRSGDEARAMKEIAYLSHYVTDAFSPLHDSATFDHRISETDTDGMHKRYETLMFSSSSELNAVADEARQFYGTIGRVEPRDGIFDIALTGQPLAAHVAAADRAANGDTAELLRRTRDFTARRFGDSLTLLASLVGSAWVDAGSPRLPSMPQDCSPEMAQGALVLLGHPLPIAPPATDVDAGRSPTAPAAEEPVVQPATGCSSLAGVLALPLVLLFGLVLRRRRA